MNKRAQIVLLGGLYSGMIGYITVVVIMAAFNILGGRSPFHTAALFGMELFYGGGDPDSLVVSAGPVLAYNMAHLLAFLFFGTVASWLVVTGERNPILQYLLFAVLILIGFHAFAGLLVFALPLMGGGAWIQIGLASIVAAGLMGWYLLRAHPVLRSELKEIPWGSVPPTPANR
jgi:hypothetical protein